MATPQQVYDYLQGKGINLSGTFDPERGTYKPRFGREYRVEFKDVPSLDGVMTDEHAFNEYLLNGIPEYNKENIEKFKRHGAAGACYHDKICVAAGRELKEVSKTLYHETLHADNKTRLARNRLTSYLPFIGYGAYLTATNSEPTFPKLAVLTALTFFPLILSSLDVILEEKTVRKRTQEVFG